MNFERDDVFTGLFVLIGTILSLGTISVILGYNLLENQNTYILRLEQLAGVKKGTKIRIKNFNVGQVDEVIPIYGSSDIFFKAKIRINKGLVLYRNTQINISKTNVIGDSILDIVQPISRKYPLKSGSTIFAHKIVNLDEMLNKVSEILTNLNTMIKDFNSIAGSSSNVAKMLLNNLNQTVLKTNTILDGTSEDIIDTLRNINKTSKTLRNFANTVSKDPWILLQKNDSKKALP